MNDNSHELFSGILGIGYGQFYVDLHVDDDEGYPDPTLAFAGQENGLCGTAQPSRIFLVTGVHNGTAAIRVELHPKEPPLEPLYDEVVEAPFKVGAKSIFLCEWGHEHIHRLDIAPGSYRVRYCIAGMDNYYSADYIENNGDLEAPIPGQFYLLQFWPSEERGDQIIKSTSNSASYWHIGWGNRNRA